MSGLLLTLMPLNAISPANINAMNRTIGGTGFLMHQDEMFRKFMTTIFLPRDGVS